MSANANEYPRTRTELIEENEQLRARLDEAEQTLNAIRSGDVDALIVTGPHGDQVFTLTGAERTYRLIVETMNEAALTVDTDQTILFCNQRFCTLVKSPMADTIGQKLTAFVAPAQQQPLYMLLDDAKAAPVQRSLTLRDTNGTSVSIQIAASLLVADGHTSICLVASDLTELEAQGSSIRALREQQQALEESQAELQAANTALRNSRMAALSVAEDAIVARRQAEETSEELRREVAERKRAEESLRESEMCERERAEELAVLFEAMPTPVFIARDPDCLHLTGNRLANEILRIPRGNELSLSGPAETRPRHFRPLKDGRELRLDELPAQRSARGDYVKDFEFTLAFDDGMVRHVLGYGTPLLDEKGRPRGTVAVLLDITERKRAEEALTELNEELESRVAQRTNELREKDRILLLQGRQAAMGEMIGNIAHQWRQPLNALSLTVQQLLLFYDLGEFNRELLDKSVLQSMEIIKHMSQTIDDFRNYFRPDKEKIEFRLAEVMENTLLLIEGSFKNHNINIEVTAKDDPTICGFKNEFAQVLLNILNNARDALVEREIGDPRVKITIGTEGGRAVVTISDNAGGIPEEIMDKIFDPYFTTKESQMGTGVGLFMSKSIIEKNMGGRLSSRNIATGAEFRIEV